MKVDKETVKYLWSSLHKNLYNDFFKNVDV